MRPPAKRRVTKRRLTLAAAAVVCWTLFARRRGGGSTGSSSSSGGGSGGGPPAAASLQAALSAGDASCPVDYRRHSIDDIRNGAKPYLLGGIAQRPGCAACTRGGAAAEWADICQFRTGHLCSESIPHWITWEWIERGHELALRLTPCDLWRHVSGRTLWVLGDSMSLDLWKSIQCFLFEFWQEPRPINTTQDAELQEQFSRLLLSSCSVLQQGTRVCFVRVDKGDDLVARVLPLLPRVAAPRDWLVVNFGLHHGNREDYQARLAAFAEYVQAHRSDLPRVLWHQTSQQHFAGGDGSGEYPGGQGPFECGKIANLSVVRDGVIELEAGKSDTFNLLAGNWRNMAADAAMQVAGIPIIPSYNETLWMHDMHRWNERGLECTHFCHPSAPQTWVVALFRALQGLEQASGGGGTGAG